MTRDEVIRDLKNYNYYNDKHEEALKKLDLIKDTLESICQLSAVSYEVEPVDGGKHKSDPTLDKVINREKIDKELKEWVEEANKYSVKIREVNRWLDILDPREREIIMYLYVKDMHMDRLSRSIELSKAQCNRIRNEGIKKIFMIQNDSK